MVVRNKKRQKPVPAAKVSKKQQETSSEEDTSSEEETSSSKEEDKPRHSKSTANHSDGSSDESSSEENVDEKEISSDDEDQGEFFTDENAAWLKPKKPTQQQLMSSSSSSSDDDDDLLEVERQAQLVDAELQAEQVQAQEEYKHTIRSATRTYHLPTAQELQEEQNRVVPPSELRERIESILEVLADFKTRREVDKSRSDYTDQFLVDMVELFGYLPELMEYIVKMLGPSEALEYVMASEQARPLVIRTNTLKVRRKDLATSLMKRGVTLDPLASWSKVGLLISASNIPIGATPEYLSGHYMLQSAASQCPVLALEPQRHEAILDMSAAPGGKTSYMAQLMANTGSIVANDLNPSRQKATIANLHRLGVKNTITCAHDGRKLGSLFPNKFDRVLLDAPCSGLGVVSRDPSVKMQRTMLDISKTAHLQKELLLSAIDALSIKRGAGYMVYSTCSTSVAENEQVVQYALEKRDIRIVKAGLEFGKPGFVRYQNKRFHPSMALTRRFYPHVHNMDGFYVAKIQKLSNHCPSKQEKEQEPNTEQEKQTPQKQSPTRGKKRGKKSPPQNAPEEQEARKQTLSIPPAESNKKQKKRKPNAKTTKPRRHKATSQN